MPNKEKPFCQKLYKPSQNIYNFHISFDSYSIILFICTALQSKTFTIKEISLNLFFLSIRYIFAHQFFKSFCLLAIAVLVIILCASFEVIAK